MLIRGNIYRKNQKYLLIQFVVFDIGPGWLLLFYRSLVRFVKEILCTTWPVLRLVGAICREAVVSRLSVFFLLGWIVTK
jgi:hypothetical protein